MSTAPSEVRSSVRVHTLRELLRDFPRRYAPRCLKIKDKGGAIIPLVMNVAQQHIHNMAEEQLKQTGMVRLIILKGRQQGSSTYVAARLFSKVTSQKGRRAFILTHLDVATGNLFRMVKRFYTYLPTSLKEHIQHSNFKELVFDDLDSGYGVGTAGKADVGRSDTIQLFHGSEVAYWPRAAEIMGGLGQAIPRLPGTEVFLESTSAGMGNVFHEMCQRASKGASEYRLCFVPWFWEPDYRIDNVPVAWVPDIEDAEYMELYGLTIEQLYWRHRKIEDEFRGDLLRFKREYPATPQEAFEAADKQSLIKAVDIVRARKMDVSLIEPVGPVMYGVDPAWEGNDRTVITRRQGRIAKVVDTVLGANTMEVAGRVKHVLDQERYNACNVDVVGIGAGVYDRLKEMGYYVTPVQAGVPAVQEELYFNLRAEMWVNMRDWLKNAPFPSIPDSDELQADLMAPAFSHDSKYRLKLESKDDMRRRGIRSPDFGDSLALTFVNVPSPSQHTIPSVKRRLNWRA